ncbi:MAG: hypothetical protein WD970_01130 [Patescibacteria group bacterium]
MKDLSVQSERYAVIFSKALKFYPANHQQQYGGDMLQLFRDQLAEAQQLNDSHILKETFLHALLGLPGSIVSEYFHRDGSGNQMARYSATSWWFVSAIFFACFLTGAYMQSQIVGADVTVVGEIFIITSCVVAILASFLTTGRILLAAATAGVGVIVVLLVQFARLSTGVDNIIPGGTTTYSLLDPWFVMALTLLPPMIMYAVASWYHAFPLRFRRQIPSDMSPDQLRQMREKILKRRQVNRRWGLAALTVFTVANLAGLYDPVVSHADLDLPKREISDGNNMYVELVALSRIKSVARLSNVNLPIAEELSSWDIPNKKLQLSDAEKTEILRIFSAAANKLSFQEPGFADLSIYKTASDVANAPVMRYSGLTVASLLLLTNAEQLRREGDVPEAIAGVSQVLTVAEAISSSQGPIITSLVANTIKQRALELLQAIISSDVTETEKLAVKELVKNLHNPAEGITASLKIEYHVNSMFISGVRTGWLERKISESPDYNLLVPALLPYTFQPNRTLAKVSENYREQIADLKKPCSEITDKFGTPIDVSPPHNPFSYWVSIFKFNGIGEKLFESVYYFSSLQRDRCQIEEATATILKS